MVRSRDFWQNIDEEELEEVRDEVDADMEKVAEYDAEEIREDANAGVRDGSYSFRCKNCGFKFRADMDMGMLCKVCGETVYR